MARSNKSAPDAAGSVNPNKTPAQVEASKPSTALTVMPEAEATIKMLQSDIDKAEIQVDKSKVAGMVSRAISARTHSAIQVHAAVVTVLWHIAQHGNPDQLNRLYAGLEGQPNDQTSIRMYVRRTNIIIGMNMDRKSNSGDMLVPDGLLPPGETIKLHDIGKVLSFEKGSFSVVQGTGKQRRVLKDLAENYLIHPDGVDFKHVLSRDNVRELQVLSDVTVLGRVLTALKAANSDSTDARKNQVSKQTRDFLSKFIDQVETRKAQIENAKAA